MGRPKKFDSDTSSTVDFQTLMERAFDVAKFNRLVSGAGLPTADSRALCVAFKALKE